VASLYESPAIAPRVSHLAEGDVPSAPSRSKTATQYDYYRLAIPNAICAGHCVPSATAHCGGGLLVHVCPPIGWRSRARAVQSGLPVSQLDSASRPRARWKSEEALRAALLRLSQALGDRDATLPVSNSRFMLARPS
jgi:hypothetical protein